MGGPEVEEGVEEGREVGCEVVDRQAPADRGPSPGNKLGEMVWGVACGILKLLR